MVKYADNDSVLSNLIGKYSCYEYNFHFCVFSKLREIGMTLKCMTLFGTLKYRGPIRPPINILWRMLWRTEDVKEDVMEDGGRYVGRHGGR